MLLKDRTLRVSTPALKTKIGTVCTDTSSCMVKLINTDCVGEIGAEVHVVTNTASEERYCS